MKIQDITIDNRLQSRQKLNNEVVNDYVEKIKEGTTFPAITVYFDNSTYWLVDGFHRVEAFKKAGVVDVEANIIQGTFRDALLYSVGVNADHGLNRTNEDKRKAVLILLEDEEWKQWSDNAIAKACKVSHVFVGKLRGVTCNVSSESKKFTDKHGNVTTMDTKNIGKEQKQEKAAKEEVKQDTKEESLADILASVQKKEEENIELQKTKAELQKINTTSKELQQSLSEIQDKLYWAKQELQAQKTLNASSQKVIDCDKKLIDTLKKEIKDLKEDVFLYKGLADAYGRKSKQPAILSLGAEEMALLPKLKKKLVKAVHPDINKDDSAHDMFVLLQKILASYDMPF